MRYDQEENMNINNNEFDTYENNDPQNEHGYYAQHQYGREHSAENYQEQEPVYAAPPVYGINQDQNAYQYEQQEPVYEDNTHSPEGYAAYEDNRYYQGNTGYQEYQEQEEEPEVEQAPKRRRQGQGEVVSTNQSINLTCTLAAFLGLFGLFLYFADQRSKAVRRMSVQSSALFIAEIALSIVLWVIGILFSVIPILGTIMNIVLWLIFIAMIITAVFLKYQMMIHAYRGEAYVLPIIGDKLRRFE